MTTLFAYSNAAGDFRLTQVLNRDEQDNTLFQFDYLYNADGLITKWTQQLGTITSSATKWKPQYDLVDQLAGVEVLNAGETATLKSYGYGYDQAGNRTTEQVGNHTAGQLSVTVTKAEFNSQNQLTDRQNSGAMSVRFAGTVNEPAKTLTINGTPATIRDDNTFVGWKDLAPGNNAVALQATDYGDNVGTLNRTVTVLGGVAKDPEYDANGNMISVYEPATGLTTLYTYDGEDRLVLVDKGGVTYTLTYDGLSRMRKLQTGGTTKTFLWLGSRLAEERNATGATVVKQFFEQGVRDSGVNKFYTFDHLGSIRELVSANGSTVLARYEYDPYGRRTRTTGTQDADFGFTGHYYHAPTGLHLAMYRAYDADLGRWLNRDPIGEEGGLNLYGYVENDPINGVDPFGLAGTHPGASLQPEMFKHLMQEALEQAAEELGIPVPQLMNTKNLWDKMIRKGVLNPKNWDLSDFHKLLDRAKGAKKCSDDMLHDLLKTGGNRGDLHKKKEKILNQFRKVLQDSDNPDVFPDAAGKVVIRSRDGKVLIPTGKTFEELLPDLLK